MGALVAAGAERLVAGPGQHDHADRLVPAGAVEGVDQFQAGLAAERVVALGAVDGDGGDAVVFAVEDIFVVHVFAPVFLGQPAMVSPPDTLMTCPVMKLASSLASRAMIPG
ncbi:hypothetical protein D3C81_1085720 [compost metagenome]